MPPCQRLPVLACLVLPALAAGCALLSERPTPGPLSHTARKPEGESRVLPPIPTSRNAIALEIVFIERPVGDPLLGEDLWSEIDQIGGLEPGTRRALRRNGFRVGHTGANPPRALEKMLGLASRESGENRTSGGLVGRRVVLASGAETEIQTSPLHSQCTVEIAGPEERESREFRNARFLFRVKADRDQEGWARLQFVPEIHHGANRLRRVAGRNGWDLRTRQEVRPLYAQRFSMTLNVGEMAVLTCEGEEGPLIGRRFFRGRDETAGIQRVLLVRLADMARDEPVYER